MNSRRLLKKIFIWRLRHIQPRQFILLTSLIIGLVSGLAAVTLKTTIHYVEIFLTGGLGDSTGSLRYLAYPFLGIVATALFVAYMVRDQISHGVARILYAISKKSSILKFHNNYSSLIASTLTIGAGGSVGSEAPIVLTGASIGSSLSRWMRLGYKERTLLLGCGAAGAIAGIFKAPIAGVVFTLEVLMLDLTLMSVVPLLISAVTGALVAFFLMGKQVIFSFELKDIYTLRDVPFFLLLGIFTGFISLYFSKVTLYIESIFGKISKGYQKVILGGLVLGILIFFFPTLYGEGYETISALLAGESHAVLDGSMFHFLASHSNWFLLYLAMIVLFKVVAMSVTTGAGGVGGIFAPTLFTGGMAGYLFARLFNDFAHASMSESNFVLNGMAGLMAGVMHAPLTGIFLIAEITGGYGLLVPLIITSTVSYLTIMYFEPHSIYTKRLAKRGELITHDKDQKVLTLMDWRKEIEKDFSKVSPEDTLKHLVHIISKSKRNVFPVVDQGGQLVGLVHLDHIRGIIFQQELYEQTFVHDLMILPQSTISINDSMNQILDKFKDTDSWNLPVVDGQLYRGFISKSRIFSAYRKVLVEVT